MASVKAQELLAKLGRRWALLFLALELAFFDGHELHAPGDHAKRE